MCKVSRIVLWVFGAIMLFAIVLLWAVVSNQSDTPSGNTASARPAMYIKRYLGLTIPKQASKIKCHVEAAMVLWVFVRFDIPISELDELLLISPLSRCPPLSESDELVREVVVNGATIPWWIEGEGGVRVGHIAWQKTKGNGAWICDLTILVDRKPEVATVYLQYVEEPGALGPEHGSSGS